MYADERYVVDCKGSQGAHAALPGAELDPLEERSKAMYLSRLTFHTLPGITGEAEQALQTHVAMVSHVGGIRPRVLRNYFASLGAPDVIFEQEAQDLETLERQIQQVTENSAFQQWTGHMSGLLVESPKREVYRIME
jgi:hypothetical protein